MRAGEVRSTDWIGAFECAAKHAPVGCRDAKVLVEEGC
jgi:hypothetical protein